MSTRQFYNTPMSSLIPGEGGGGSGGGDTTFYDLTPLTEQQREAFNDLFALTPPLNFVETHMWFGKKPVGFFGTGNYKLFLQNGTFTMQSGTTYRVRVVGGGGGGGRDSNQKVWGGAGGGYSEKIITCKAEEVVNITVGAGGAAGESTTRANGQAGGTSSFGAYLSATGGGGGSTSTSLGGTGAGGDINYTGGNCSGGWGGASAASDFGNGISKTYNSGGNGLQSTSTGVGGGGLFGNTDGWCGGGLWGEAISSSESGGGMFARDGGACYTDSNGGVYTLDLVQPQKYKTSNSAELQQNSFLQKDGRQGLLKNNYEFTIRPMFGMGANYDRTVSGLHPIVKAGFGGGGAKGSIPGWGGGWSGDIDITFRPESKGNVASRPYSSFYSSFGGGGPFGGEVGGNGAGVITGGEVRALYINDDFRPQGGLGGGGGGSSTTQGTDKTRSGNPGGYGAVLVEW